MHINLSIDCLIDCLIDPDSWYQAVINTGVFPTTVDHFDYSRVIYSMDANDTWQDMRVLDINSNETWQDNITIFLKAQSLNSKFLIFRL